MTYELEVEDKRSVIDSHIRRLTYEKYNTEISVIVEESSSNIDNLMINSLNEKITDLNNKIQKLEEIKSGLISQE
jgi:hypothetical protein